MELVQIVQEEVSIHVHISIICDFEKWYIFCATSHSDLTWRCFPTPQITSHYLGCDINRQILQSLYIIFINLACNFYIMGKLLGSLGSDLPSFESSTTSSLRMAGIMTFFLLKKGLIKFNSIFTTKDVSSWFHSSTFLFRRISRSTFKIGSTNSGSDLSIS